MDDIEDGHWSPIHLSTNGPPISHLFFADGLILFGEASSMQVEAMISCMERFCSSSGLKVNRDKTKVCFSKNVHVTRALEMSNQIRVGLTSDLGKYLGIPLLHERASCAIFSSILEKTKQRLDRKSTRLNSSHSGESRMPSSA